MGFVEAVKAFIFKYVSFSGRAPRSEYWWFVLFVVLVSILIAILDTIIFGVDPTTGESIQIFNPIFQLAMFLPMLAAGWRRLHDTGRPGWYLLLPMSFSFLSMVMLFAGVAVFAVLETGAQNPEQLRGPAALFGATGLIVFYVLQLILSILMILWLSRPSQEGPNAYGSPAT